MSLDVQRSHAPSRGRIAHRRAPKGLQAPVLALMLLALGAIPACSKTGQKSTSNAPVTTAQTSAPAPPQPPATPASEPRGKAPRRIILMIGDGMGVGAVTSAAYTHKNGLLNMLTMPHTGWMTTHEHEYVTTDSAAAATAMATGDKTHYEGLSVKPGTTQAQEVEAERHLETAVEVARKAGLRTGLVATSRIVHATPAAFASHRANRNSYEDIALDMASSGVDVLLGAGSQYFAKRKDGRNLLGELEAQGYAIALDGPTLEDQRARARRLVGLVHEKDMPFVLSAKETREAGLAQMLETAVEVLDRDNEEGFFLMVEGSFIDWAGHELHGAGVVSETHDFDEAVGAALRYARGREDTLVVVTADHETGALSALDPRILSRHLTVLGGETLAAGLVAQQVPAEKITSPHPPVQTLPLVGHQGQPAAFGDAMGLSEVEDRRLVTSFGYLGYELRPVWPEGERYSAPHTANLVPLFAEGPGAREVAQVSDNTALGNALHAFMAHTPPAEPSPAPKAEAPAPATPAGPRNVILLIGDGMGMGSITLASYVHGALSMTAMPVKGLVATHGTDSLVNDSAATATALSTGHRTRYGTVGMAPAKGQPGGPLFAVPSVLELAEGRGLKTGLVTSTTLSHATPAAFYAHEPSRAQEASIAAQFATLAGRIPGADGVDVALGGGMRHFDGPTRTALEAQGYVVLDRWTLPLPATGQKLIGLMAPEGLPSASERHAAGSTSPTLAAMTEAALGRLEGAPKGFFLMVEGGQIDWAQHGLDRGPGLVDEMVDFDQAVAVARSFAQKHGDTLVIVTADHDHTLHVIDNHYAFSEGPCKGQSQSCPDDPGRMWLPVAARHLTATQGFDDRALQGSYGAPKVMVDYSWVVQRAHARMPMSAPHSANFVPLFAEGAGAGSLGGFFDQPALGQILVGWARGEGLAAPKAR